MLAVYNEPLVIESLKAFGYPENEARRFANDGCWEVQIPGRTCFTYIPFDGLRILLDDTLGLCGEPKTYDSFEALYSAFRDDLKAALEELHARTVRASFRETQGPDWEWAASHPCAIASMLTEDCIQRGRSFLEGGPRYTVVSPHFGGAPDVGNSLHAIHRLVFLEKRLGLPELSRILQENWEGNEYLRLHVRNSYTYYGNDDDVSDGYTVRVLDDFADLVASLNGRCPILFPAGVSTFGRQIEWAPFRAATPSGHRKGEILSGNASPTPGSDIGGVTAMIRSYCRIGWVKHACGAALDVKLDPTAIEGDNGILALVSLIGSFVDLGGFFMQVDVVDSEMLRAAQRDPESYRSLCVRVSGWNARFAHLSREWQDMIIERTAHPLG